MDEKTLCSGKAGPSGQQDKHIICVHICPLLVPLMLHLFDGVSEHLLVELYSRCGPLQTTPRSIRTTTMIFLRQCVYELLRRLHNSLVGKCL